MIRICSFFIFICILLSTVHPVFSSESPIATATATSTHVASESPASTPWVYPSITPYQVTPSITPDIFATSTPIPVYSKEWLEYSPGSASGQGISLGFGNPRTAVQVVLDQDGEPAIAWDSLPPGEVYANVHVLKWNGGTWNELGRGQISKSGVSENNGLNCISVDPADQKIILSTDFYRNNLLKFDGSSWLPWANGGIDDPDGLEFFTDIVFLPDNTPVAFYHHGFGPAPSHFRVRKFVDGYWKEFSPGSAAENGIAQTDSPGLHPRIFINKKGEIYAVWQQDVNGSPEIYVMEWSDGKWELIYSDKSPASEGNSNGCWISLTPMCFDNDGNPILAYHKVLHNINKGRILKRINGIWKPLGYDESSEDGFSDPGQSSGLPVIMNTPWNYPLVFWYNNKSRIYAKYYDGIAWKPLGDGAASGDGIASMGWSWSPVSAVINKNNEIILAYANAQNNDIYIKKFQLTPPADYVPPTATPTFTPTETPTSTPVPVYSKDWVEYSPGSATGQGISKGFGNPLNFVHTVMDKDGEPVIGWDAKNPDIYSTVHILKYSGSDWIELGPNQPISSQGVVNPAGLDRLTIDPADNNLVISMNHYKNILMKYDGRNWVSWAGGGIDDPDGLEFYTDIDFLPDHTPLAFYHHGYGPTPSHFRIRKFVDGLWKEFSPGSASGNGIADSDNPGNRPKLSINAQGEIFVAWHQIYQDTIAVYVSKWTGVQWERILNLTIPYTGKANEGVYMSRRPLCFDINGNPIIAYQVYDTNGYTLYVKKYDNGVWKPAGDFGGTGSPASGSPGGVPMIIDTPWRYPIVIWYDSSDMLHAKIYDGNTWKPLGEGSVAGEGIGTFWARYDAFINKKNEIILSYANKDNKEIYVKKFQLTPPADYVPPTATPTPSPTPVPVYSKDWVEYSPGSATGQGISKGFGYPYYGVRTVLDKDSIPVFYWDAWDQSKLPEIYETIHVVQLQDNGWKELGRGLVNRDGVFAPGNLNSMVLDPSDNNLIISYSFYRNYLYKYINSNWVSWAGGGTPMTGLITFWNTLAFLPDNTPVAAIHRGDLPSISNLTIEKYTDQQWTHFSSQSDPGVDVLDNNAGWPQPEPFVSPYGDLYVAWKSITDGAASVSVAAWSLDHWEMIFRSEPKVSASWGVRPVCFDSRNNLYISFYETIGNKRNIHVMKRENKEWKPVGYDSMNAGGICDAGKDGVNPIILMTPWDYPIVIWYDMASNGGIFAKIFNSKNWVPLGDGSTSYDGIGTMEGKFFDAVINKNQELILSYVQKGSQDIYVKKFQLTPPADYVPPTATPTPSPTPAPEYSKDWVEYNPGSASGQGISKGFGNPIHSVQIVMDKDGQPVIGWDAKNPDLYSTIHVLKWAGTDWTEVGRNQPISLEGVVNPAGLDRLTIDPADNNLLLSLNHYKNLLMKFDGKSWSSWTDGGIDDPDGLEFCTDIAFSADNTPLAFYISGYGPNPYHYRIRKFVDTMWKEFNPGSATGYGISDSDIPGGYPHIFVNNKNEIYAVWSQPMQGTLAIYIAKWYGSQWEKMLVIHHPASGATGTTGKNAYLSTQPMCFDANGNPILAYQLSGNNTSTIHIVKYDNGAWNPVGYDNNETGFSTPGRSAGSPMILNTPWGYPVIFWNESSPSSIYAKYYDGNDWKPLGEGAASGDGIGRFNGNYAAAVNDKNEIILPYVNPQTKDIYVKKYQLTPPENYQGPAPSPTPAPIPGWFVLDGYGGVHSSNPAISLPVLPYFMPFDIARDLEPDPLGRGWYMLDGFGGIHTSSPDLPKPTDLPYFGYDIARNLEIVNTDHGYEFYMLDGYGVVHSTDKNFNQGTLPWFGFDIARDLEPEPNSNAWMVLDGFGLTYSNKESIESYPLQLAWHWAPLVRSMVLFPNHTNVVMDAWGGRHTNPRKPAANVVNGLPGDFYFPGFDIIWDLELIPEKK